MSEPYERMRNSAELVVPDYQIVLDSYFGIPGAQQLTDNIPTIEQAREAYALKKEAEVTALNELRSLATTDPLTGLPNRRGLGDRFDALAPLQYRHGLNIAVAMVDLDGFKAINDSHGHQAGDTLLVAVAKLFKRTVRREDIVSRLGGDEFVIVTQETKDEKAARVTIDRIYEAAIEPVIYNDKRLNFGMSIGVAVVSSECLLVPDILEKALGVADKQMYRSKAEPGKNSAFYDYLGDPNANSRGDLSRNLTFNAMDLSS